MATNGMRKYKEVFLTEAKEHVAAMNTGLVALEKDPGKRECLSEIFRASHTLKSMAASMGYTKMEALCHATEDLLDAIRHDEMELGPCVETLYGCFDALEAALQDLSGSEEEPDTAALVEKLTRLVSSPATQKAPPAPGK